MSSSPFVRTFESLPVLAAFAIVREDGLLEPALYRKIVYKSASKTNAVSYPLGDGQSDNRGRAAYLFIRHDTRVIACLDV